MFRKVCLVLILIQICIKTIESVQIEYPIKNKYIEERIRSDLNLIDPLLRYYVVQREIQFQSEAVRKDLPFFLRCKGSKKSLNFTVPSTAIQHLTLTTDTQKNTITAELRRKKLTNDLVGRYTCSETIKNQLEQTTVHVYIFDGRTVFTKKLYPNIAKETGIHFFNVPCQTTSWYGQLSCPKKSNERDCESQICTPQERQTNELKCNMPVCKGQQLCIPVSFTPADSKAEKVLFDPQIGFALFNPTLPTKLSAFTCTSLYTPRQVSRVPFDTSDSDFIQIHQPSLSVTKDETLKLTCEIQYGSNIDRRIPNVFWFEDIHNLNLVTNETDKPLFQTKTQLYSQNTTLVLRDFKPNQVYRFYCVRVSDKGLYTRSVDITCANASTLDVEISSSGSDPNEFVSYGSDGVYYISIFTIPRSPIRLELSRKNIPLTDDKRFVLSEINNQDNQFFEYTLTISKMSFEDAEEIKLAVKSSVLEKIVTIKPNLSEDPIGQLGFLDQSILTTVPWRDTDVRDPTQIYPYGIAPGTSYRIICSMRHRADINTPLNVFIQYFMCNIDNCLSTLIDKTCQTSSKQSQLTTVSNRINDYQTDFISSESHRLTNPSMAYQYLCCYENKRLMTIGKAIAVASNARELFHVQKPKFTLVKGDILTYSCQAHDLLYRDLRIFYHDDYSTYETSGYDRQWHVKGTNQVRTIGLQVSSISEMRTTGIEVKTPPMQRSSSDYTLQCIAQSKRPDIFSDKNDTYIIRVDDPVPLKYKVNSLPAVSMMVKKSGENILLDCTADGRPEPRIVWYRGKLPLIYDNLTIEFGDNNQSISIKRAQPVDTGYYTCELNNGRDPPLKRSFDLRIKGSNPYSRIGRLITAVILIAIVFLILLLALLTFLLIKYIRMKKVVNDSIFHHQQPTSPEDPSQSALSQLTNMRLPDNFASSEQIHTLLNYVNGDTIPDNRDDFKALGRGQFGVVYQVRLPTVGLVAAKCLPDHIRRAGRRHDKRKRSRGLSIDEETNLNEHDTQKRKAAEMLIDEIKVMHRAGKHVNIVALKKVAYPATRFKFVFTSKPMRDEDSFYLMELCGNGSLESMLKHFLQSSMDSTSNQRESLYEKLAKTNDQRGMNLSQACDQCQLTEDDLKLIAYQVACGIDYLNRRQIAHCDIAARNVLVNSRFVMKICDFGLATWTTYRNYREQLATNDSVHLEKKTTDIATHNLTPELGKAFLNPSDSDERLLLKKASIKADVWSFGIFLWSLFLKCKFQPFYQLAQEVDQSGQRNFFYRLAREVSDGHVLRYIDYQPEIPANVYAVIQLCLVEENQRPETPRVRSLLCHSKMLSKQAFEFYRMEYNRYQEENSTDETIECFGDYQGVADLPSFDETKVIKKDADHPASTTTDDFSYAYGDDSYPLTEKDKQQPPIDPKKTTQTGTIGDPVDSYL